MYNAYVVNNAQRRKVNTNDVFMKIFAKALSEVVIAVAQEVIEEIGK